MSINSMTDSAVARRAPAGAPPPPVPRVAAAAAAPAPARTPLAAVVTYIPTEIIAVYVAVVAAMTAPGAAGPTSFAAWVAFAAFLIATPIVVWLTYAAKVQSGRSNLPTDPSRWPRWEMAAGTVAFAVWAFALPQTPFISFGWYTPAVAGVAILVVSTSIGLLAPFVAKRITL
jgi:hypothetical protein